MKIVKVTYAVKPGFAKENQKNVTRFIEDLREMDNSKIRYASFLAKDGKTFTHLALFDSDASQNALFELETFKSFQKHRDNSGLEVLPAIEELELVSASYPLFN